jgi:hypothetical protein
MIHTGEDEVADLAPYRIAINFHLAGLEESDPSIETDEQDREEVEGDDPPA